MEGTAQCFVSMLASESWMVVHIAICAIHSRIFRILAIDVEDSLDPLHIELLVIFVQVLLLANWTCWIGFLAWIQVGLREVDVA